MMPINWQMDLPTTSPKQMDSHPCIIKIHSKTESAALVLWLHLGIVHSTVTMVIWLTSDMLFKAGPMGFVVNSGAASAVSGELFWFINSLERKVAGVALIWFYDCESTTSIKWKRTFDCIHFSKFALLTYKWRKATFEILFWSSRRHGLGEIFYSFKDYVTTLKCLVLSNLCFKTVFTEAAMLIREGRKHKWKDSR